MAQIREHINSKNHNFHPYNQIKKMIVNLGINEGDNNYNSSSQFSCQHNLLLMSIFETSEKGLSHIKGKAVTREF